MSGESIEWGAPGALNGIDDGGLEGMGHYGDERAMKLDRPAACAAPEGHETPLIKCAPFQRSSRKRFS
jgi:hypothetical protein